MKLSNQNICNLRGCQMPLGGGGGGANHLQSVLDINGRTKFDKQSCTHAARKTFSSLKHWLLR